MKDEDIGELPLGPTNAGLDSPDLATSTFSTNDSDTIQDSAIDPFTTRGPRVSDLDAVSRPRPEWDPFEMERRRRRLDEVLGIEKGPPALERYVDPTFVGSGAMGNVYAAQDSKLNRKVAIKLLQARNDGTLRERFLREAQAMARLTHPNVVQIHDVGTTSDGEPFIAMEYVDGVTLERWLTRAPRSIVEIGKVFRAAGDGLAAVHAKRLVHRDFKPDNVMVGNDGRVLVTDFGLAGVDPQQASLTAPEPSQVRTMDITKAGGRIGTPAYMAPEQLREGWADAKSDQFAYCVSFYRALYGERPFPCETREQLLSAIEHGQLPPAPAQSEVPTALRDIVVRGLQPRPEERFESMQALLDALQAWLFDASQAIARAPPKYVFILHDARDKLAVLRLCEELLDHGVRPWLDIWDLSPDVEPLEGIRKALIEAPAVLVCHALTGEDHDPALADTLRSRIAADPRSVYWVGLPGVLESPASEAVARLARLIGIDSERASWLEDEAAWAGVASSELSPYRGLEAFRERDARWMFGRAEGTAELLDRIRADQARFLMVTGASGSGKSSLIMAGLCPALRHGVTGDRSWTIGQLRPGAHPCKSLAAALVDLQGPRDPHGHSLAVADLCTRMLADADTLRSETKRLALAQGDAGKVLLVVDQLEELFTEARLGQRDASPEAMAFVRNVIAATERSGTLWVVATLRADFISTCLEVDALARAFKLGHHVSHPAMSEQQIHAMIVRPAKRVGFEIAPRLIEKLVAGAEGQVSRLPLLQHVLRELWQHRDVALRTLSHEIYDKTGGLERALANAAERTLDGLCASLGDQARRLTRQVMTRLVHLGEGTAGHTRRQSSTTEFGAIDEFRPVLDAFHEARALVSTVVSGVETFEIAHEALLREWTTLVGWLAADRDALRLRQELAKDAEKWRASHNREYLWGRGRIEEAKRVLAGSTVELNEAERAFLHASHRLARRRLWVGRATLGAVTLAALIVAIVVLNQNRKIDEQLRIQQGQHASMLARVPGSELAALTLAIESVGDPEATTVPGPVFSGLTSALVAIESGLPLQGHQGKVRMVAFSPDGAHLVTAGEDKTMWWDANSGADLDTIEGFACEINAVALSPDGTQIASACTDNTARIRTAETEPRILPFEHESAEREDGRKVDDIVLDVVFSPDGDRLATAGRDQLARIWDIATRNVVVFAHAAPVRAVAFSPDGDQLASASDDGALSVWDSNTGALIRTLAGHEGKIYAVTFSGDGTRLASGSDDGTARIWDPTLGQSIGVFGHDRDVVHALAFSSDGETLATGTFDDNAAHLWDVATTRRIRSFRHAGPVVDVALSPSGLQLATASWDKTARSWNVNGGRALTTLEGHTEGVYAVAASPDGTRIATGSGDDTARLWDTTTGAPLAILRGHRQDLSTVVFSLDGKLLVSGSWDGFVRLWDGQSGSPIRTLSGHRGRVLAATFSPDASRIATAGDDKCVRVWDSSTGEETQLLEHDHAVIDVTFSADGTQLLAITEMNTARLWDASTGQPSAFSYEGPVTVAAFSPVGSNVALATKDHDLLLWNPQMGIAVRRFTDRAAVTDIVFSPDGSRLATASEEGTARVWNVVTGEEIVSLYQLGIVAVAFTSDGARLVTASGDEVARLWTLEPQPWLAWGCTVLDERQAHVTATREVCRATPLVTPSERGRVDFSEPAIQETDGFEPETITVHGMELVLLPKGTFMMGSPEGTGSNDEHPQHPIELDGFYLGRTEVTNAQYARYLEAHPSAWQHDDALRLREPGFYVLDEFYRQPEFPATYLSWYEAKAFCEWAGLTLPTEAQWEYAARAGTTTSYWFGEDVQDLVRFGWVADNSGDRPHRVATKGTNAFGLYDMAGNASEWVLDGYTNGYERNLRYGDGLRYLSVAKGVHRGGDWEHGADFARSGVRYGFAIDYREEYLGVRCAREFRRGL